jgi:WD40 repeat protein
MATLTGTSDAGFSCAWNHSSDKIAVASQDGFVSVWDIRYMSSSNTNTAPASTKMRDSDKLAKLGSKQSPQVKGACRCVKFSPSSSIDLLLYSEHVSYVNLVDARTFNEKQSIRLSPQGVDQHITGVCWSPDSRGVFVGKCLSCDATPLPSPCIRVGDAD